MLTNSVLQVMTEMYFWPKNYFLIKCKLQLHIMAREQKKGGGRKKGVEFRKTYCIYLHVLCADVQQNCEH